MTGSTRDQLRRLSVLIAIALVDMIGFAIIFPILPFYVLDLKATPIMVGVLTAAFSAAQILSAPIWGRVSDRYGRRPALLIGLVASGLAYDSDAGRCYAGAVTSLMGGRAYAMSARMAEHLGTFAGYGVNQEPMLGVIRKHRKAAYQLPVTGEPKLFEAQNTLIVELC